VWRAADSIGERRKRVGETAGNEGTGRSVVVAFAVALGETVALGIGAGVTGSVALRAQTAANFADVAVELFLLIGLISSGRPPDDSHPLGYGRERYFWSLFAALGIFVGGAGLAIEEAVRAVLHPAPVGSYPIAYVVLASTVVLDVVALEVALRPLRRGAAHRGVSLRAHVLRTTDPAAVTVVVGGGCAVVGGIAAAVGLVMRQNFGFAAADAAASALIGLLLLMASVMLLQTNRELLSGRGVSEPMLREMRAIISGQPGVVDVPDLFAVVVGPSSLIADGDVTFDDEMTVPDVETTIARSAAALRERWPSIEFVYLTPVPRARQRRAARA
jgi:cation diffusion facilitator family transporter